MLSSVFADNGIPSSPPIPLNGHKWPKGKTVLGILIDQSCVEMKLSSTSQTMPEIIWRATGDWHRAFSYFNFTGGNDIKFFCKQLKGVSGLTYLPVGEYFYSVRIEISTAMRYQASYTIRRLVNHELGHAFGLDHATNRCDLMYAEPPDALKPSCRAVLPTEDDVKSLMFLYQTPIPEFGFVSMILGVVLVGFLALGRRQP